MKFLALISVGIVLTASAARAQHVGISGSFAVGVLEDGTTSQAWESYCLCNAAGTSLAQQAMFSATLLLLPDERAIGASARLGVGTGLERFISRPYVGTGQTLPPDARLEYREQLRSIALHADIEGRLPIGGDVWLTFGPWLDYRLQSTLERTEHVLQPEGATFPDGDIARAIGERRPEATTPLSLGGSLGVSFMVEVSKVVRVIPHLALQANVGDLADRRPGGLFLTAGSTVVFDIRGRSPVVVAADTPEPPRVAAPSSSRVNVDLYAIENGTRIQSATVGREIIYRKTIYPAPHVIAFTPMTRNAAAYFHTTGGNNSSGFALDSLFGLNPDEIDRRAPDILGMRMASDSASRITLVGTYGASELATEGAARANVVRSYLISQWGIGRRRITTGALRSDGETEVRASGAAVDFPIVLEWLDERFHLPQIGVEPTIDAPRGVRSSSLRLTHRSIEIANVPVSATSAMPEIAIDLSYAMRTRDVAPVVAVLTVIDSSGEEVNATDELPLELPVSSESPPGRERITLLFIDCVNAAPCNQMDVLEELRKSVRPGARVVLSVPSELAANTQTPSNRLTTRVRALLISMDVVVEEVTVIDTKRRGRVTIDIDQRAR